MSLQCWDQMITADDRENCLNWNAAHMHRQLLEMNSRRDDNTTSSTRRSVSCCWQLTPTLCEVSASHTGVVAAVVVVVQGDDSVTLRWSTTTHQRVTDSTTKWVITCSAYSTTLTQTYCCLSVFLWETVENLSSFLILNTSTSSTLEVVQWLCTV